MLRVIAGHFTRLGGARVPLRFGWNGSSPWVEHQNRCGCLIRGLEFHASNGLNHAAPLSCRAGCELDEVFAVPGARPMNAALISDDLHAKARAFTQRPRELLIGGRWQPAHSGASFEVVDPANGRIFAHAASGDAADIDDAVKAARAAFEGPWGTSMPAYRARLLLKLADLIEANGDELALLETLDNGMPFRM